jgi:ribonuclease BN (tRNA processing enzyme)
MFLCTGDAFGIPALLSVCKKEGRTGPVAIYGPTGAEQYIKEFLAVARKKKALTSSDLK